MLDLAAFYYLGAKTRSEKPLNPVPRFHLAMAPAWSRLNWPADNV